MRKDEKGDEVVVVSPAILSHRGISPYRMYSLEVQCHTCKNTHQLLILLKNEPLRSNAAEPEALGISLPLQQPLQQLPQLLGTEPTGGAL